MTKERKKMEKENERIDRNKKWKKEKKERRKEKKRKKKRKKKKISKLPRRVDYQADCKITCSYSPCLIDFAQTILGTGLCIYAYSSPTYPVCNITHAIKINPGDIKIDRRHVHNLPLLFRVASAVRYVALTI